MNYTAIEFNSRDEWVRYTIPSEGACHFIVKENGKVWYKYWYQNGKRHREGGLPSVIWYDENGKVEREYWYQNGELHREGGLPAVIWYHKNGKVQREYWFTSKYHITLHSDGDIGIGCHKYTLSFWLENWEAIAKKYKASDSEIQEYRKIFDFIQARAQ